MQAERWRKIETVFNASLKLPIHERENFVVENCGDDDELCEEIFNLLSEAEAPDDFLSQSVFPLGAQLLDQEFENLLKTTDFGFYRLETLLGRGGVGAVFVAEDSRLGRRVALKILPSVLDENDERVLRFQQEARTASAISHPNIAHIYEFGSHKGHYFLSMEYIEGQTLRQYLRENQPDLDFILNTVSQIAKALSAAHEAGVIHRDIKPENVMIMKDKTVKVLDFGLAKPSRAAFEDRMSNSSSSSLPQHADLVTMPGLLIGTAAYMSPEQARCEPLDARTDIWSLGVLFYEMLVGGGRGGGGKHPFHKESNIETLHAIMKEEPEGLPLLKERCPPLLVKLVMRCLSKNREERFQTARDFLFSLEAVSATLKTDEFKDWPNNKKKIFKQGGLLWRRGAIALFILALALAVFYLSGAKSGNWLGGLQRPPSAAASVPSFNQLTFRRGTIWAARFVPSSAADAVYSATWNGGALDLFTARGGSASADESRSLHLPGANLLSISKKGELAILLTENYLYQFIHRGTLATMPLDGGRPRAVAEDVQEADWSPDGENLAIVRWANGKNRLEYPIGRVLYETAGYISSPRVSPKGDLIAFLDHQAQWDNRGYVAVVDLNGGKRVVSGEWSGEEGLAWTPDGEEIWFTATRRGEAYALYAVRPDGKERIVSRLPVNLMLHDIAADGRVLLAKAEQTTDIYGAFPGQKDEKNLSWLHLVGISDFSDDGRQFLFTHFGEGTNYAAYVRRTDNSPAARLGDGRALALSPDGRFALTKLNVPEQLLILPVAEGEIRRLPVGGIEHFDRAGWFADGQKIIFTGNEAGKRKRAYAQDLTTGEITALTPEGIFGTMLSPDNKRLLVTDASADGDRRLIVTLETGEQNPVKGLEAGEQVIRWSGDGRFLFTAKTMKLPVKISRLDPFSGQKSPLREIAPADPAGNFGAPYVFLTPDGQSCLYGIRRYIYDLYVVEGLR
jgi:eukaryotic-like serine/threonine-protein kinase